MSKVVGRDAELASLQEFVGSVAEGACALVLEGDAGMGKTTLWNAGLEAAGERGLVVLKARPSESETSLSFAGLGDLVDPVLEQALECLPEAQKRALSRALVVGDDDGPAPDPHAVGVAVLAVLRELAANEPLLVAVDDVQWLDAASGAALVYASRRLESEQVGVLLARRSDLESTLPEELRRSLPATRFAAVDVGPLDAAALHRVVQEQLGISLPRPLLAEVHQTAGGNPFYALEIIRTLRRSGVSVEAGQPLPVPESLHDLVHGRLLALPPESRDFLLAAAAHAHPTLSITEAASGVDRGTGLTPALSARIVELDGDRVRFTHPLLAAGAYETADPLRRAQIHSRLAELLVDPEARAWQLAASVEQPDETIAETLEDAARHARARGAPRPAALLLDRARELTPGDEPERAFRRTVEAAYLHFEAGDAPRAETKLRSLVDSIPAGRERGAALLVLARIRSYEAVDEAAELFRQVVDEAQGDSATLARAHEGIASCLYFLVERLGEAVRHAEVAFALAEEIGESALSADILITKLGAEALLGRTTASETAGRALALEGSATDRRLLDQPLVGVAVYWLVTDEPERTRETVTDLLRRARELGDESSRAYLLFLLGAAESVLGGLEAALECGREGREAAEQSGQPLFVAYNLALEGAANAQLGRAEPAREATRLALELIGRHGLVGLVTAHALGQLELALGAPDRVVTCLEPTVALVVREGIGEPAAIRFVVDQVEALIELGRRVEAVELLEWYEGNARRLKRASALASCARCRGSLAAQTGDVDAALAAYEEALGWHAKVELPLDRGRTLLALGAAQRRVKRRREARATLEQALAVFERIGAALWADRARAELRRISGRAATPGALTPAEEKVAALVAEGKTNREVAAALFLSDRTVEGHLSHIFGKLGIRHRAELASALGSRQTQGIESSNTGDSPVSADRVAP